MSRCPFGLRALVMQSMGGRLLGANDRNHYIARLMARGQSMACSPDLDTNTTLLAVSDLADRACFSVVELVQHRCESVMDIAIYFVLLFQGRVSGADHLCGNCSWLLPYSSAIACLVNDADEPL